MKLHYHVLENTQSNKVPVILLHGLFGSADNLNMLARELRKDHPIIQVDLRNHGLSPHADEMSYPAMAEDLLELLDTLQLHQVIVIGHSMGGKVAMALTAVIPERIIKLIVLDIAPVAYQERQHDTILSALNAVEQSDSTDRRQAAEIMRNYLNDEATIQFLLKSFHQGHWLFNLAALQKHYMDILGWQTLPPWSGAVLFIKGGESDYIQQQFSNQISQQFPLAKFHVIANSGHWLHAEKTSQVLAAIQRFLHSVEA